jgi:two-component system, CAI-1 autoinducer sensor kinase/phosphatase CqsS
VPHVPLVPVTRAVHPAVSMEYGLLDETQLEELVSLDMLDQSFLKGIGQIRSLLAQLESNVEARDIKAVHVTLHLLLGVSGNIGAKTLYAQVKQIYPRVLDGQWPANEDWLERITTVGSESADALQRYFVTATAPRDQRDVMSDD